VLVVHYFKVRTLVKLVKMGSAQQSFNIVPFNMDFLKCVKGCLGGLPIHKNVASVPQLGMASVGLERLTAGDSGERVMRST